MLILNYYSINDLQGKKSPIELVPMPNRHEGQTGGQIRQRNIYGDSVAQLEQNMKFLQDQHQVTLVALHQEVENLRQRNRGNLLKTIHFFISSKIT